MYSDLIRVCVDGSLPPCHNYEHTTIKQNDGVYTVQYLKYIPSFSNPLPMLRVSISTSLLYNDIIDLKSIYLYEDISQLHEDIQTVIAINNSLRELTIHWDRMTSSDSIQSISTSLCFCWLQDITSQLPDRFNNSVDLNNLVDRLIVYDSVLTSLITACSSLMYKQYHLIRSIVTHAQSQSSINSITSSDSDSFDPRRIEPFRILVELNHLDYHMITTNALSRSGVIILLKCKGESDRGSFPTILIVILDRMSIQIDLALYRGF